MTTTITERLAVRSERIDADSRTLFGVAVLRTTGAGGARRYSPGALADVARLLPGTRSFQDHGRVGAVRPVADLVGSFSEGRVDHANGDALVRGNFTYLPAKAAFFEALAVDQPVRVGFSVSLQARTRKESGVEIIDGVESLGSVDLVSATGSTSSLWESAPGEPEISDAQMLAALGVTGRMLDAYQPPLGQRPEAAPAPPFSPKPADREPSDAEILAALR